VSIADRRMSSGAPALGIVRRHWSYVINRLVLRGSDAQHPCPTTARLRGEEEAAERRRANGEGCRMSRTQERHAAGPVEVKARVIGGNISADGGAV
jgi:hypothetical protein